MPRLKTTDCFISTQVLGLTVVISKLVLQRCDLFWGLYKGWLISCSSVILESAHMGFFDRLVLVCLFCPITSIFSGNKCGSLGPFWLPSSAWPKITCDLRFLISNSIPPAALTSFGHVSLFQDLGIKTWVSSHRHQLVSVNWMKLYQVQECKYNGSSE